MLFSENDILNLKNLALRLSNDINGLFYDLSEENRKDNIDGCYNIICKLHKIFEVLDTRIISLININHAYIGAFDEAKADILRKLHQELNTKITASIDEHGITFIRVYEKPSFTKYNNKYCEWISYAKHAIEILRDKYVEPPFYNKAFIAFNIHHPLKQYNDYFDCDNAVISPFINGLKGTLFQTDSREHMSYMVTSTVTDFERDNIFVDIFIGEMAYHSGLILQNLS